MNETKLNETAPSNSIDDNLMTPKNDGKLRLVSVNKTPPNFSSVNPSSIKVVKVRVS